MAAKIAWGLLKETSGDALACRSYCARARWGLLAGILQYRVGLQMGAQYFLFWRVFLLQTACVLAFDNSTSENP